MTASNLDHLARLHTVDGLVVPRIAHALAGGAEPELVWRNDVGGLSFRLGDRFLKWNPASTGIHVRSAGIGIGIGMVYVVAPTPTPPWQSYGGCVPVRTKDSVGSCRWRTGLRR